MGIVTEHLKALIRKQVADHGIVVWYDPGGQFADVARELTIDGGRVALYEGSFFALRRSVDDLVEGRDAPPRLVVHVPLEQAETHYALAELEALGAVMRPGDRSLPRNTRLSVVAKAALRDALSKEALARIEADVEAGRLGLRDLDGLGERESAQGVLSVIFGGSRPDEIAVTFLARTDRDAAIEAKDALPDLVRLLEGPFEVPAFRGAGVAEYRAHLARHVLVSDLAARAMGELPSHLGTLKIAEGDAARASSTLAAREWRLRRDLRESYRSASEGVARDLRISAGELAFVDDMLGALLEGGSDPVPDTFLAVEEALQRAVVDRFLGAVETPDASAGVAGKLVRVAEERRAGFWPETVPEVQAFWALLGWTGRVLDECERVGGELRGADGAAVRIGRYAEGDAPWCRLDSAYRHMEWRYQAFEVSAETAHQRLEHLVHRARSRYAEVVAASAEGFVRDLEKARFSPEGVWRQRDVFEKAVKPELAGGKTAYVLVDGLRFEMARELADSLSDAFEVDLRPAVATVPTITEIGMAALLPCGGDDLAVEPAGKGKLALRIGGSLLRNRKERVAFLSDRAGATVYDCRLDDLLPTPKKKVRDAIAAAGLVLVMSTEIDQLCEQGNLTGARSFLEELLRQLARAVRKLAELGASTVVVAADHGFLLGEEIDSDMKVPSPGGETIDLHGRVWVGRGGETSPSYLRAKLSDFGLGGGLELATPWGLGCFAVQGGTPAYCHGGLSPQELIVPVLKVRRRRDVSASDLTAISWELTLGSPSISTRFCSAQIHGRASGMFELKAPRVRLDLRAGDAVVSRPVSASYGFLDATQEVQLRCAEAKADEPRKVEPNTVTLQIQEGTREGPVSLHLLDAATGVTLAKVDSIPLKIAF